MAHNYGKVAVFLALVPFVVAVPLKSEDDRLHGEFTRTLGVSGPTKVKVTNSGGDITVHIGPEDAVTVLGTISAGTKWDCERQRSAQKVRLFKQKPALEQVGDVIRLGNWGRDHEMERCTQIDYDIRVPIRTNLLIENGYGDIKVLGLGGPIAVVIEAGGIRIDGAHEEVKARIGAGTLTVEGSPRAEWFLDVDVGSVLVRISEDAHFTLDAEAENGTIDTGFPATLPETNGKTRLQAAVNGGGPRVRIRTRMGSISLWEK